MSVQGAVEPIFARQGNGSEEKHQKKIYGFEKEREQARKEERGRDSDNIATYPLLHFLPPTKSPILFQRKN